MEQRLEFLASCDWKIGGAGRIAAESKNVNEQIKRGIAPEATPWGTLKRQVGKGATDTTLLLSALIHFP